MTLRFAQGGPDRHRSRLARPALALVVPLALATLAYARVLDGDFQFDDSIFMAAYNGLGRVDEVEATLRHALARGHAEPDILTNLAGAVMRRGDAAEAESLALGAIAAAPGDARAWSVLGEIALGRHDWAAALPMFERCLEAAPALAGCRYSRGLVLAALGRIGEACASWAAVDLAGQPELRAALERAVAVNRCGTGR